MERIVETARDEYATETRCRDNGGGGGAFSAGIERLVERFTAILEEFHVFTRPFRQHVPVYDAAYATFVESLTRIYGIEPNYNGLLVNVYEYSTDVWGPLYWRFFHYASLLLADAMSSRGLADTRNFGLLVRNIDAILPCQECASHYREIRDTPAVEECIRRIAFGYVASALHTFHNHVTLNVRQHLPQRLQRNGMPFLHVDFAATYGCVERTVRGVRSTKDYVRPGLDWQPELTRALTLLLMLRLRTNFSSASDLLKGALYGTTAPAEERSRLEQQLSDALLTRDMDRDICEKIAPLVDDALRTIYRRFPAESRALVEALDDDDESAKQKFRTKAQLLAMLQPP